MENTNEVLDVGEIIERGVARREAERLAGRGGATDAELELAAVADAAEAVARIREATGRDPLNSVAVDAIFVAAGIAPTTDNRGAAIRAGRRIDAGRLEVLRQAQLADNARPEANARSAISDAKFELDRVGTDPKCGLDDILGAVVALRRATGPGRDAVTFAEAIELVVQYRAGLS